MKSTLSCAMIFAALLCPSPIAIAAQQAPVGDETQACIDCHDTISRGLVEDWRKSRHARFTPAERMNIPELERRISAKDIPAELKNNAVGCYECHSRNPDKHKDNFEHYGYKINVVVSPDDCSTCHPEEADQYSNSKKGYAVHNLSKNPLYSLLVDTSTGVDKYVDGSFVHETATEKTKALTCFACHGTELEVEGMKTVTNSMFGDVKVPNIKGWPNQGVGRINPDGSRGACTACHPRHSFDISIARKPYTCGQCHLQPDVPAYDVYKESKHGNIFMSNHAKMNFTNVPWIPGDDITVPTCATCHNSMLATPDGDVIAERTHDFGDRLSERIFGLIYSHPQPKSGKTYEIKNADGLPLPTTFTGEPASEYLISKKEQQARRDIMKSVCASCHSTDWVDKRFDHLDHHVKEIDKMVLTATKLMQEAWDQGLADNENPFDEALERRWIEQWLFYANASRYATAMMGPDYSTFKLGWWELTKNLREMKDKIRLLETLEKKEK